MRVCTDLPNLCPRWYPSSVPCVVFCGGGSHVTRRAEEDTAITWEGGGVRLSLETNQGEREEGGL